MTSENVTMLDILASDLQGRMSNLRLDRNRYTFYLKELDAYDMMQKGFVTIMAGLRRDGTLVDIAASIGRQIRKPMKLKPDSIIEVQTGWFVMISFFEVGIMDYILKSSFKGGRISKNKTYFLRIVDWTAYKELISLLEKNSLGGVMPSKVPHEDWVGPVHVTGTTMVKKMHKDVKAKLNVRDHPILFKNLNKLQNTGWAINPETFSVFQQCLAQATSKRILKASPFKFAKEADPVKRKSLIREAESIGTIALTYLHSEFFHMYNYDFRFRVYVLSAYLHEQSSDNAKGMLQFSKGVPMGDEGFEWFKVHMSNTFGHDKDTIAGRIKFVDDRLETFIEYAENPMAYKGWMSADAPFSFLSCCFELRKIKNWIMSGGAISKFVSHIPCFIDG